jgi:hypothetical protein
MDVESLKTAIVNSRQTAVTDAKPDTEAKS